MRKTALVSYSDTFLSTYAINLETYIRKMFPYSSKLKLCKAPYKIVKLAYHQIQDEVETILKKTNEMPIVIIGRSPVRKIKRKGLLERERIETFVLTPKDGSKPITMQGRVKKYLGDIQIIVIARDNFTVLSIADEILEFHTDYKKSNYDSIFTNGDKSYRVKGVTTFKFMDTHEKEFSDSSEKEKGMVVLATEYEYQESKVSFKGLTEIDTNGT